MPVSLKEVARKGHDVPHGTAIPQCITAGESHRTCRVASAFTRLRSWVRVPQRPLLFALVRGLRVADTLVTVLRRACYVRDRNRSFSRAFDSSSVSSMTSAAVYAPYANASSASFRRCSERGRQCAQTSSVKLTEVWPARPPPPWGRRRGPSTAPPPRAAGRAGEGFEARIADRRGPLLRSRKSQRLSRIKVLGTPVSPRASFHMFSVDSEVPSPY